MTAPLMVFGRWFGEWMDRPEGYEQWREVGGSAWITHGEPPFNGPRTIVEARRTPDTTSTKERWTFHTPPTGAHQLRRDGVMVGHLYGGSNPDAIVAALNASEARP